jgi:hypothetical protein
MNREYELKTEGEAPAEPIGVAARQEPRTPRLRHTECACYYARPIKTLVIY